MAKIKLKAEDSNQQIILNYLEKNSSDSLAERINTGSKTIKQCWNYILSEARKLANGNCACIDDATVFGWAVHFFEEDTIKGDEFNGSSKAEVTTSAAASTETSTPNPATKVKKVNTDYDQISFADLFG